jgi:hypothetical protein
MIVKLKTNTVSLFNILMAMCILFLLLSCIGVSKTKEVDSKQDNQMAVVYNYEYEKNLCFDSLLVSMNPDVIPIEITNIDSLKRSVSENIRKEIDSWIEESQQGTVKVYFLSNTYLIMSGLAQGRTGISFHFYSWLLIDIKQNKVYPFFISLSCNKKTFYIKDNQLNLLLFTYGASFYEDEYYYDNSPYAIDGQYYVLDIEEFENDTTYLIYCPTVGEQ